MIPDTPTTDADPARRGERPTATAVTASTAAFAAALLACGSPSADDGAELRFAMASFQHETCTFCPGGDTEIEDWFRYSEPLSGDALLSFRRLHRRLHHAGR